VGTEVRLDQGRYQRAATCSVTKEAHPGNGVGFYMSKDHKQRAQFSVDCRFASKMLEAMMAEVEISMDASGVMDDSMLRDATSELWRALNEARSIAESVPIRIACGGPHPQHEQ